MKVSSGEALLSDDRIRDFIRERTHSARGPSSVYRLQFNRDFTFTKAAEIVPFLRNLGIDAVYSSPYFQTPPGSPHGYNITDPNRINPEVGTEIEFDWFCKTLKDNDMTQILDVVPNHMGISGGHNRLWLDVLENGPSSEYARFFDINWEPLKRELQDKVLLPILGDYYGRVLERQEIFLAYDQGRFTVNYYETALPINPRSYPLILEHQLDELREKMGENDRDFLEFLSVVKAFRDLPPSNTRNPDQVRERNREQEISKRRLAALSERSRSVQKFIEGRIRAFNGLQGQPRSFDLLDGLLNRQSYRLAFWRVASEEINYRRFFDVNDLAAIRMEDPAVFNYCHHLIFRLVQEGKVQGLRIDHPDGLYYPREYFRKLQARYLYHALASSAAARDGGDPGGDLERRIEKIYREEFPSAAPFYVVAEKILDRKESLPEDWNIQGTVGYDFLNVLNGVFIRSDQEKAFDEFYESFIGHDIDLEELIYAKKKFFALVHMASEINMLGFILNTISEQNRLFRDLTLNNLTLAVREVIACFPVYRTYISPEDDSVSKRDEKYIRIAIEKARVRTPALNAEVYDFLCDILLLKLDAHARPEQRRLHRDFVLRFQQLTAPVMAKGMEDTVFYIDNRFVSLNEVGGDPGHFGHSIPDFHKQNLERAARWPYNLLATSTHDSKRSEDIRMRLDVLSELPDEWKAAVPKWAALNEKHKTMQGSTLEPRRNTEYFVYQTLIGAWPNEPMSDGEQAAFADRLWEYLRKSAREAKIYTNWTHPNLDYEKALEKFLRGILSPGEDNAFLRMFLPFQKKVAAYGMLNSLSASALKIGSPGVADFYQGNELWTYRLVDPDNRRPVDYRLRAHFLRELQQQVLAGTPQQELASGLMRARADGRIKLYFLWKLLNLRSQYPELFLDGKYIPLKVEGERTSDLVAFLRIREDQAVIVLGGRFFTELAGNAEDPVLAPEQWKDTAVFLPPEAPGEWKEIFTGRDVSAAGRDGARTISAADALGAMPAACLTNLTLPRKKGQEARKNG